MELEKKNGCIKVEDPYFGKRKPSATLKRIHRKISLLESQKEQGQTNQERVLSAFPLQTRKAFSASEETKSEDDRPRSNEELNRFTNTEVPRERHRASTAPGALSTSTLTKDPWPTKDEFVSLLFRMI